MTLGTIDVTQQPHMAVISPRLYISNDRDPHKVWNGVWSTFEDMGITAPSGTIGAPTQASGNVTVGDHLVRYRYRDSTSPQGRYRSNPSDALTVTVSSSTKQLTFSITDSGGGGDIIRSADNKVDTIVIEMTTAAGTTYYVAKEVANTATSAVVNISDTDLANQDLASSFGGEFGHEPPPLSSVLFTVRDFAFACAYYTHDVTVDLTNGSATVSANSDSFADGWDGRLFRRSGDSKVYLIDAVTQGSPDTLTLSENYAGTTGTGVAAKIFASQKNRIFWSAQFYPESFKAADRALSLLHDIDDVVVGGTDYLGDPWFFGRRTTQRHVFSADPSDGETVTVSGSSGIFTQRCLVKPDEDTMLGWGANGVWAVMGGRPRWISRPADRKWRSLIDYANLSTIHGVYEPDSRSVFWYFRPSGGSGETRALKLDLTRKRWAIDEWRQPIRASSVVVDGNGRVRAAVSDSTQDQSYYLSGDTDGVPSGTGSYTADSGSTTTVTQIVESLPTGGAGSDLRQLAIYRPSTDESKIITSNTANTITHAAFATAVAAGEDIFVGSIPVVIESSWWVGQSQSMDKRPRYLHLVLEPSSTASTIKVEIFKEFASSAHTWTRSSSTTPPRGITYNDGDTFCTVDMDLAGGFVSIPLPADFVKSIRFKLTVNDPAGTFKLLDYAWAANERKYGGGE